LLLFAIGAATATGLFCAIWALGGFPDGLPWLAGQRLPT
jgi:hypothetical protein